MAEFRERPILFSSEMVRAILAGTKTQTRRVLSPQPELAVMDAESSRALRAAADLGLVPSDEKPRWRWRGTFNIPWPSCAGHLSPYGVPGEQLWVRETWGGDDCSGFAYRADHPDWKRFQGDGEQPDSPWRPSIYMPRRASRLLLEITSVRAERLHDISEEDAIAEGVVIHVDATDCPPGMVRPLHQLTRSPMLHAGIKASAENAYRWAYACLWESINGKRAPWASNPWVWAVSFQRVETTQKAVANG
jgi:hypothetical protein